MLSIKLNILNTEVCKINNDFYLAKEKYYVSKKYSLAAYTETDHRETQSDQPFSCSTKIIFTFIGEWLNLLSVLPIVMGVTKVKPNQKG